MWYLQIRGGYRVIDRDVRIRYRKFCIEFRGEVVGQSGTLGFRFYFYFQEQRGEIALFQVVVGVGRQIVRDLFFLFWMNYVFSGKISFGLERLVQFFYWGLGSFKFRTCDSIRLVLFSFLVRFQVVVVSQVFRVRNGWIYLCFFKVGYFERLVFCFQIQFG